VGFDVVMFLV